MPQLTARLLARHGFPKNSDIFVVSPYSGRRCSVVAAKECGSNVVLTLESGFALFVKAAQKVDKVKRVTK
jgi:hypothetical protein